MSAIVAQRQRYSYTEITLDDAAWTSVELLGAADENQALEQAYVGKYPETFAWEIWSTDFPFRLAFFDDDPGGEVLGQYDPVRAQNVIYHEQLVLQSGSSTPQWWVQVRSIDGSNVSGIVHVQAVQLASIRTQI